MLISPTTPDLPTTASEMLGFTPTKLTKIIKTIFPHRMENTNRPRILTHKSKIKNQPLMKKPAKERGLATKTLEKGAYSMLQFCPAYSGIRVTAFAPSKSPNFFKISILFRYKTKTVGEWEIPSSIAQSASAKRPCLLYILLRWIL